MKSCQTQENSSPAQWSREEAIELATLIEAFAPEYGCHVGLTGGCLYKVGPRKDCDFVIYRIRQVDEINVYGFFDAIENIGIKVIKGFGFCYKCEYQGKNVDFLFPEEEIGIYPEVNYGLCKL